MRTEAGHPVPRGLESVDTAGSRTAVTWLGLDSLRTRTQRARLQSEHQLGSHLYLTVWLDAPRRPL